MLPERNCSRCTAKHKEMWGCASDALVPLEIDGEVHNRCPRRPIFEEPAFYADLFHQYACYQRGQLPEDGGLNSQPGKLMMMFRIIDAVAGEIDSHKRSKQEAAAKKNRRPTKRPPARRKR